MIDELPATQTEQNLGHFSINIFKDIGAGFRDMFGRRSQGYEDSIGKARETTLAEMVDQAIQLEANGAIAVDIDYESVGQGDVMMVAESGTAVRLYPEAWVAGSSRALSRWRANPPGPAEKARWSSPEFGFRPLAGHHSRTSALRTSATAGRTGTASQQSHPAHQRFPRRHQCRTIVPQWRSCQKWSHRSKIQ